MFYIGEREVSVENEFFANLYKSYYNYLFSIVKKRLYVEDIGEIEACIQQVFLIAIEKKEVLMEHDNPRLWLAQTARFVCHNYNKKLHLNLMHHNPDCLLELKDNQNTEHEVIEKLRLDDYVQVLKAQLSEEEFAFLCLKYENKLSSKEIGKVIHTTSCNVNAKTKRLKEKVKKIMYSVS